MHVLPLSSEEKIKTVNIYGYVVSLLITLTKPAPSIPNPNLIDIANQENEEGLSKKIQNQLSRGAKKNMRNKKSSKQGPELMSMDKTPKPNLCRAEERRPQPEKISRMIHLL